VPDELTGELTELEKHAEEMRERRRFAASVASNISEIGDVNDFIKAAERVYCWIYREAPEPESHEY
jgi:hypothetical protein